MFVPEPKTLSKAAREGVVSRAIRKALRPEFQGHHTNQAYYNSGIMSQNILWHTPVSDSCRERLSNYITELNPPDSGGKIV